MKFLLMSDMHLRASRPQNRVDDYLEAQNRKLDFIIDQYHKYDCECILQAGDLFDSPKAAHATVASLLGKMTGGSQYDRDPRIYGGKVCMLGVLGQHDVYMHSLASYPRTPTYVLKSASVYDKCGSEPFQYGPASHKNRVHIYGASWGEDIPRIQDPEATNVLVAHKMVGDRRLFEGHKLSSDKRFARIHSQYDLILLGDFHYTFYHEVDGTHVLNTGCMMRTALTEEYWNHIPHCVVWDSNDNRLKWIPIPCDPPEKVFGVDEPGKESDDSRLLDLVDKLREGTFTKVSFKDMLMKACKERDVSDRVREKIDAAMEEVGI